MMNLELLVWTTEVKYYQTYDLFVSFSGHEIRGFLNIVTFQNLFIMYTFFDFRIVFDQNFIISHIVPDIASNITECSKRPTLTFGI